MLHGVKIINETEKKIAFKKRVLMIAYHFPPIQGSSGVHRTVQFARHLPKFGWAPIVVAPHSRAYPATGDSLWAKLPEECIVKRAFALDSSKHFAVKGRYFEITAIPDRWISWWPAGVFECLRLIRTYKPHVIWSTFPVATAHLIGLTVSRLTGLPWVADFRDPMIQEGTFPSRLHHKVYARLEKEIVRHSSCCTLVTHSAKEDYRQRYPDKDSESWQVIENGYDESLFAPYAHLMNEPHTKNSDQPIKILHSGVLYSSGRNPLPFLEAVKSFIEKTDIKIEIIFRSCGNEAQIGNHISRLGLAEIVKMLPSISYDAAIKEMIQADVLALFQGTVYNRQIPAKVYEYIRAGKPILAMTDQPGETARMLKGWDGVYLADMTSKECIECAIASLFKELASTKKVIRNMDSVMALSRYAGTKKFAGILRRSVENHNGKVTKW